jgi:hypothetical protein
MSFWAKVGVKISDLTMFKNVCRQHGIEYNLNRDERMQWNGYPVHAILRDTQGGSQGYLVREGGAYRLALDTDAHYSSITRRLGANGGKLMRDYAVGVVRNGITQSGGMVTETVEQNDGSIVLRAASM